MDTKDIMIGDFVRYTEEQWETDDDKAPRTITGIGEPEYPDNMPFVKIDGSNERYHIGLFEPIPLTAEVLEKNAKSITKVGCRTYYEFSENFAVKQINNDNSFFFCEIKGGFSMGKNEIDDWTWQQIDNLHELQHALRLVGLNELVDNLKV